MSSISVKPPDLRPSRRRIVLAAPGVIAALGPTIRIPLSEVSIDVAREVIEKLVDDLDGGDADETVQFGLDGASYEIDLSKKNAAALRKALVPYLTGARKSTSARTASRGRTAAGGGKRTRDYDLVQLRDWAGANDVAVPSRGRVPQAVVEQYKAAGGR